MNNRVRQRIKAVLRLQTVHPIWALLKDDNKPLEGLLLFIDPRDWDEAKAEHGDKLKKLFEEDT